MAKVIEGLFYSDEHEWVKVDGNIAYIGISDHAQDALGDLVYADCGVADTVVSAGDAVAVLESVKAASDVYTPVSGTVIKVNSELCDEPEKINADPYGCWLFVVEMSDTSELDGLMSAEAYDEFCKH